MSAKGYKEVDKEGDKVCVSCILKANSPEPISRTKLPSEEKPLKIDSKCDRTGMTETKEKEDPNKIRKKTEPRSFKNMFKILQMRKLSSYEIRKKYYVSYLKVQEK